MRIKIIFAVSLLLLSQTVFSQSVLKRKTNWTVLEVKEWVEEHKHYPTWHGWLLYLGSDTAMHHFISRVMDEWTWFNIRRTELVIKDERQFNKRSSVQLGYYYVDASKNFTKIKDY